MIRERAIRRGVTVKRIIAASLAVACLCQTALAADVAIARVTYPSWTGFYVGVNTGGSLGVGLLKVAWVIDTELRQIGPSAR
jgi:hypothetical protein